MSEDNQAARFAGRFLASQRARGRDLGPLFGGVLERIATDAPPAVLPPPRFPEPETPPAWMVTPEELDAVLPAVDFAAVREAAPRPAPVPRVQVDVVETLTACLDRSENPPLARAVFRLLFELGLEVTRVNGCPTRPDVAVFHLPQEMIAAHFQVHRTTIYRALFPLLESGVLAERDHYDTLRGATAVSGKLWAVSLYPERVMSGRASPARITKHDLAFQWRDLDRDARTGRTVYDLTRTEEQKAAYRAEQQEKAEAQKGGKKESKKPRATRGNAGLQQSVKSLKAVDRAELEKWVLTPFLREKDLSNNVTLTVASGVLSGKDAIFTLPALAALPKAQRGAAVEETARALCSAFEDTANLRFWLWLVWQTLRSYDQGEDVNDEVMFVLSRVLTDVKHDESMSSRTLVSPGAAAVNLLRKCGLLDRLRAVKPYRVGSKPAIA